MQAFLNRKLPLWLLLLISNLAHADKSDQKPAELGNFSLPTSQQPGPFVCFGENIIDQGQTQLFIFGDAFIGKNSHTTDVFPSVLYGIRDDVSFFLTLPFSPGNRDGDHHSCGFEDVFAQGEYAFYVRKTSDCVDQATVVANVAFPTGSSRKNPPTGLGSTSFFLGATFNHMTVDWLFFASPSVVLTTSKKGSKSGNQFWYQGGIGRNIPSPSGWIFAWMVEWDGIYAFRNKIKGRSHANSGGNTIYMTPSIWISSKRVILQVGAGYPIVQHLFGRQSRKFMSVNINVGVTF